MAPPHERRAIFDQVRGFRTIGEAGLYTTAVTKEIKRSKMELNDNQADD
jgi:hypothetical protein